MQWLTPEPVPESLFQSQFAGFDAGLYIGIIPSRDYPVFGWDVGRVFSKGFLKKPENLKCLEMTTGWFNFYYIYSIRFFVLQKSLLFILNLRSCGGQISAPFLTIPLPRFILRGWSRRGILNSKRLWRGRGRVNNEKSGGMKKKTSAQEKWRGQE